jgi:Transglutaminase-like superfamily
MRPKAPNIGLNNIYLSHGRKPPVLSPRNIYHFGVKNNQIEFLVAEFKYSIFKDSQGRHNIYATLVEDSGRCPAMRSARLSPGRNEFDGIIIIKRGDAFEVKLGEQKSASAPLIQPSLQETMRDSKISIEMARVAAEDINVINYLELPSAERLQDGDILPGHKFVLGKTETYGRELLTINLGRTSAIYEVMQKAREIAGKHSGGKKSLALKIADMVDKNYSDLQGHGKKGFLLSLGFFQEEGGCCRHRAAELQLALQEAGIRSRYVRGRVFRGWHAWVEVDVKGDGSFSQVIDPNMGVRGEIRKLDRGEEKTMRKVLISRGVPAENLEFYKVIDESHGREEWYFVDRENFNVVWRRREYPKPVQIGKEELLNSFSKGADVVRKNGVFLLRKRAGKATGPNVVYVTVVDRAAYDLYLAWDATK